MKKLIIILFIALITCKLDESFYFNSFQQFIKKYDKKYNSLQEFMARYHVFKNSFSLLKKHETYREGITQFFDLTPQEFRKTYLNLDFSALATINAQPVTIKRNPNPPKEFNWMDQKVLGEIKDQLKCGCCYAFSTMGNIEGQAFLKKKMTVTLSEQQMVDCDKYDSGCHGGLQENTYYWIIDNPGLMQEKDYPYKGEEGSCNLDKSKIVKGLELSGWKKLGNCPETWCDVDEEDIRDFLLETGPLAIALNGDLLQRYEGGIISADKKDCDPDGINYGVVLVGYGTDTKNKVDFWIVRNSSGKYWGEKGYFRIKRGSGTCGINRYITTSKLK